MKKFIAVLTVLLCFCSVNVNAVSLGDMTERLVKQNKIQYADDDLSGISRLQNRKNIKNPQLISSAIKNEILIAKNGLVNENSTDYTPLIYGLIKKYVNSDEYSFVTSGYVDLERNKNVVFNDDTFYVTENADKKDLNYNDIYTCIVNRDKTVLYVWKAVDVRQPALYRVKLYWAEPTEMIVTEVYRKQFDLWVRESYGDFSVMDVSEVVLSEDFILKNLDEYIYLFADNYEENVIVKGVSKK